MTKLTSQPDTTLTLVAQKELWLNLTQIKMSSRPVAVQFSFQFIIPAVHVNSFRVEVYGIVEFLFPVFLVTFLKVHLSYCYTKGKVKIIN